MPGEYTQKILSLMDDIIDDFQAVSRSAGPDIFKKIVKDISVFDITKGGRIKPTTKNLKRIKALQKEIEKIILSQRYLKGVASFLSGFKTVENENNKFFKKISKKFNPGTDRLDFITQNAIESTESKLLESGIRAEIINPIMNNIKSNIGTGAKLDDVIETIRNFITKTDDSIGALDRYAGQIATDSLNIFHAERIRAGSEDLGLTWFLYSGGLIKTSRHFCEERAGKFFHQTEIESWANEKWAGKNPNTNPSNIYFLRGGYNCRHQFEPVSEEVVPESDLNRIK